VNNASTHIMSLECNSSSESVERSARHMPC
jgi:hypothetical protein